jgi:arylsulfatase A-like enzyme
MNSRTALLIALACALFSGQPDFASADLAAPARPPNILFLLADDLGWADVGYQGGPFDTPHIDALAATGLRLKQHYVQPLCSPTRAELLTGRYASRIGLVSPTNRRVFKEGQRTLASSLVDRGYFTALSGKWHLGSNPLHGPTRHGFQEGYGALAGGLDPYDHKYRGRRKNWYRNGEPIDEEGHVTDLIARQVVTWIEQHCDEPFFIYVPFTAVHTPMREPEEYLAPYRGRLEGERLQLYGATITHLDDAVGQISSAIERMGLDEKTLIIFTSDNGATHESNTQPLRGVKGQAGEGGIRVPTIVRWKGRIEPGELNAPVGIIDWLPTLTRLAGAEGPSAAPLDGRDIGALLVDPSIVPEERTLFFRSIYDSAVRQGRFKFVKSPGSNALYDIESDPEERNDLIFSMPEKAAELQELLKRKEAAEPPPRKEI